MHKLKSDYITLTPNNRLYDLKKPIIGLTGGIASGKSTVSQMLKNKGIPLIDADMLVKKVYQTEESINFISKNYPKVIVENKINFLKLRELVFNSSEIKQHITSFIYKRLPSTFIAEYESLNFSKYDFCIYDVPLLFEKKLENLVDTSCLVYCSREIQETRLVQRDQISSELANKILNQQMPIEEKKNKAEIIINNSRDMTHLEQEVELFLAKVLL